MLSPTLDKWNLKIPGNDRLVDYFIGSLGNSKVQPEMRSPEAPYHLMPRDSNPLFPLRGPNTDL